MSASFVHLHLHSEYSLVDGIIRIKDLVRSCAEKGMPAVAITDQSNMFAMVKFYRAALSAGVKPIVGVDVWIQNEHETGQPYRMVLLCRNQAGYLNMTRLVSESYLHGQHRGIPMLERDWLKQHADGLIALSGAGRGDVGRALLAGRADLAEQYARHWASVFPGSYYMEVQRTGRTGDEDIVHDSVRLAEKLGLPVVASNDVHFINSDEFAAHETRVCIHDGRTLDDKRRPKLYSAEQYLRSPEEMQELFEDLPEAIDNTLEIARRCNVSLTLGKNYLPDFPVPEGMNVNSFLESESYKGLDKRLQVILEDVTDDQEQIRQTYRDRLKFELDVIIQMGFPGYFLIVADFIRWAKNNAIPVGPGRGSGAGSLVAYALDITDLDPIKYDLLFERFLNPERVSMPDFDVDFCMEQRDRVIGYVADHYGREKVSQIITYGTMAAKAVVRDVGRVLGHPYGFVDRIAKLIPFEIGITLKKAIEQEDELAQLVEDDEDVSGLMDLAMKLEGVARNAGKHAGGVVIAPSQLTDFTALYCEQGGSNLVTQFDKDDVEAVGLVKFDFLGLRTLTIIDWAVQTINQRRAQESLEPIDITRIDLEDKQSFELLKRHATTAVFQLESSGMKDLIKRLQPDSFEDIVALVALFRPGPLQSGMVDDFIDRKHGARVVYPHPDIEPILQPTYGVILYQEQVMQIAQVLAGYTLGGADMLRRAMGKKKPEEMAKQRSIFTEGAKKRGVDEKIATGIFDLMEKFAGYGFNKSHSAAYALVSYQTIWLKTHYPAAFMAAVLSSDMDNTDKVVTLIEESRDMRLAVQPPDVNASYYRFTVTNDETVVYGLGAIKGVGQAAIESILEEREANGAYKDLYDFCRRIDTRKVNRRVLEALIRAGALDTLPGHRASLLAALPDALKAADQHTRNNDIGMEDMFGGEMPGADAAHIDLPVMSEWSDDERLSGEKETLGLYLTGHPFDQFEVELGRMTSGRIATLTEDKGSASSGPDERQVIIAGLVSGMRTINTRRGRMAIVTLDDRTGRVDATLFSDVYEKHRDSISRDAILVMSGNLGPDDYSGGYRLNVENIFTIDQARERYAKRIVIKITGGKVLNGFVQGLSDVLGPYRQGACPVWIHYQTNEAIADMPLGVGWSVRPCDELLQRLRKLAGEKCVSLVY